jgi:histidine triad (HIT) family protein
MEDCIFCKIIKEEIPSRKVYEDKDFLSFLDIYPVSFGHILVIPKEHIIWMQDASDKTISDIFQLCKKLMLAIKKAMNCDYVQLAISGIDIQHFHIHLIPRYKNDGLAEWPTKNYKNEEEKDDITKKIISAL